MFGHVQQCQWQNRKNKYPAIDYRSPRHKQNLGQISSDLNRLAADIETLNDEVADLLPVLTSYQQLVTRAQDELRLTRARLDERWTRLKWGATLLFIWLGLTQLSAVYLGLELLTGRRPPSTSSGAPRSNP